MTFRWIIVFALSVAACRADRPPAADAGVRDDARLSGDVRDLGDDGESLLEPEPLTAAEILAFENYCRALESAYQGWRDRCHPWAPGELAPECFAAFDEVAQRRLDLRDDRVQPCLEALEASRCTAAPEPLAGFGRDVPECAGILRPLVPNGSACTPAYGDPGALQSSQCADGWCDAVGCPPVCRPFREQDELCDPQADQTAEAQCGAALWCGPEGRCSPRVAAGSVCASDSACEQAMQCLPGIGLGAVGGAVSGPRTCERPLEIGASCDPDLDLCRHRSACVDGVCSAHVRAGDVCGAGRGHAVCPADHFCMGSFGGEICVLQASTEACLGQSWCLPGQTCQNRACIVVRDPCWANVDCAAGEWCDGREPQAVQGGCAPTRTPGAPCLSLDDPTADCEDGLVCVEGHCTIVAALGESCAQLATVCDSGLVCREGGCAPPSQRGDDCYPYAADTCEVGLGCTCVDLGGSACTCEPLKPAGSLCFVSGECESSICQPADGGDPTCQPGSCPP